MGAVTDVNTGTDPATDCDVSLVGVVARGGILYFLVGALNRLLRGESVRAA